MPCSARNTSGISRSALAWSAIANSARCSRSACSRRLTEPRRSSMTCRLRKCVFDQERDVLEALRAVRLEPSARGDPARRARRTICCPSRSGTATPIQTGVACLSGASGFADELTARQRRMREPDQGRLERRRQSHRPPAAARCKSACAAPTQLRSRWRTLRPWLARRRTHQFGKAGLGKFRRSRRLPQTTRQVAKRLGGDSGFKDDIRPSWSCLLTGLGWKTGATFAQSIIARALNRLLVQLRPVSSTRGPDRTSAPAHRVVSFP